MSFSEYISYDVLDRSSVPRAVFLGGTTPGTDQDQRISWPQLISGPDRHTLILEYNAPAAHTFTTANFTVLLNVFEARKDGGVIQKSNRSLKLADRVTISGSTRQSPNGINDNPATLANQDTPIIAFQPETNMNWVVAGYQRFVSDGT